MTSREIIQRVIRFDAAPRRKFAEARTRERDADVGVLAPVTHAVK